MKKSFVDNHVTVGRVRGAYGIRGHLRVESLSDVPERFQIGATIFLGESVSCIEHFFWQKNTLILKLDSIKDRNQALAYKGCMLTVDQGQVGLLPEGQFYHFQILDMRVQSESGDEIGNIVDILITGTNDVYVVKTMNSKEILLPAIPNVVLSIDVDSNLMTVRLLDGLTY